MIQFIIPLLLMNSRNNNVQSNNSNRSSNNQGSNGNRGTENHGGSIHHGLQSAENERVSEESITAGAKHILPIVKESEIPAILPDYKPIFPEVNQETSVFSNTDEKYPDTYGSLQNGGRQRRIRRPALETERESATPFDPIPRNFS